LVDSVASTAPIKPVASSFSTLIEKRPVDSRYYLSPNAAQGIVRRVDKLGRTLFPPLDAAVRYLASVGEQEVKAEPRIPVAA
jgi:DNA (cytosine-5)-methyltransferase 1